MPTGNEVEVTFCLTDGTKLTRIENIDDITTFLEQHEEYVKIVRCKDCKHNGTWSCMVNYGADEIMPMDNDNFCSWGERREE